MYRGSSFLLQQTYTIHSGVVEQLTASRFPVLREREFGAGDDDEKVVPITLEAVAAIHEAYWPFVRLAESGQPTDTLVTKIILGTLGSPPACDRFFIDGFKSAGLSYSSLNAKFVERVLRFCKDNLREFREEQQRIEQIGGMRYPLMKLVDMYFWQIGFERDTLNLDAAQPSALS
jgi:hypothetical protein